MKTGTEQLPRVVIKSIGFGLLLMALFTMVWTGIAQAGLQGRDHYMVLFAFAGVCLLFIGYAIRLFSAAKNFPVFTTDEHATEGRRTLKAFGLIFGIEGTAIPITCVILKLTGLELYILPAIALIVGLHFYPMAHVFNRVIDYYLATYTCILALTAIYLLAAHLAAETSVLALLGIGIAFTTISYGFYMMAAGYRMLHRTIS